MPAHLEILLHVVTNPRRPGDDPLQAVPIRAPAPAPFLVDLTEAALDVRLRSIELGEAGPEPVVDPADHRAEAASDHLPEGPRYQAVLVRQQRLIEANVAAEESVHPSAGMPDQIGDDDIRRLANEHQRGHPSPHRRDDVSGSVRLVRHPHHPWFLGQAKRRHGERRSATGKALDQDIGASVDQLALVPKASQRQRHPWMAGRSRHDEVEGPLHQAASDGPWARRHREGLLHRHPLGASIT